MRKIFSCKPVADQALNVLSEAGLELARNTYQGTADENYSKKNAEFNTNLVRYCVDDKNFDVSSLKEDRMTITDPLFIRKFAMVLAQVLTPVIPEVVSKAAEQFVDIHTMAYGDTATFRVESNELFVVNELAEGVTRGALQPLNDKEYTVRTSGIEIATYVEWYQVASGVKDWGAYFAKVGYSLATYFTFLIANKLGQLVANAGSFGIAGYQVSGYSKDSFMDLAEKVKGGNGGNVRVIAIGTKVALSKLGPDASTGFRFFEGDDLTKKGLIPEWLGVPLVPMDQVYAPHTINTAVVVPILPDDIVFLVPVSVEKFVKVVLEGTQTQISREPKEVADMTYVYSVNMRVGADLVVASKIGTMLLAGGVPTP